MAGHPLGRAVADVSFDEFPTSIVCCGGWQIGPRPIALAFDGMTQGVVELNLSRCFHQDGAQWLHLRGK